MKAFIDIETGGFSVSKNGTCEIAMVITDQDCNPVTEFQRYIKPYRREDSDELVSYKEDAMTINGLSVDFLHSNGDYVSQVVRGFLDKIEQFSELTVIGHNSTLFDVPRLNHLIHRFYNIPTGNYKTLKMYQQEDTMMMAKKRLNLKSYSLENLCSYFGIINQRAHSALSDVYATIELYKKLKRI